MEDEESTHVREVFAYFGLAMYLAQVLEHGIVNALIYLDLIPKRRDAALSAGEWSDLVDAFSDTKFEYTLGRMIRALREVVDVPPNLEAQLLNALQTRNWLAHRYFRERGEALLTQAGRESMLAELADAQDVFRVADESLEDAARPARERAGITDDVLAKAYAQNGIPPDK